MVVCLRRSRRHNIARLDAACRLRRGDATQCEGMYVRSLTVASADILSQILQLLVPFLQEASYRATDTTWYLSDLCSVRNKYLPWMYPEWTGYQSLSPHTALPPRPESRCFLRLSYHNAIHAAQIAVSTFSRGPSASPRPAELHSASAAGTA